MVLYKTICFHITSDEDFCLGKKTRQRILYSSPQELVETTWIGFFWEGFLGFLKKKKNVTHQFGLATISKAFEEKGSTFSLWRKIY